MAIRGTKPIRFLPAVTDWLQSIQKSVKAAGCETEPTYSAIFEVMRSYTDRQVIVDTLVDLYKQPEETQIKASIQRAKAKKARAKT